jgi:hypothetical protein
MEKLNDEAVRLLTKVKQLMTAEPRRVDMTHWVRHDAPGSIYHTENGTGDRVSFIMPPCGTTACIAGHLLWARDGKPPSNAWCGVGGLTIREEAQEILGVSRDAADNLFLFPSWALGRSAGWPQEFVDAYVEAHTAEERAQAVCDRIDHAIQEGL